MQISGSTRVFMILGDPVAQVRAPELFNPLFQRHGVDAVLVPAHVPPAGLAWFVRHVFAAGNLGRLWLTIPHKTPVFHMLSRCDRRGTVAQSVNDVRRAEGGGVEGTLFDGVGFVKGLGAFGLAVEGTRALVVGLGGAGAAIAVSLAECGVAELSLFDIDPLACAAIAARIRAEWSCEVVVRPSADPAGFDLTVNATPLGLKPDDPLPFDPARVSPGAAVVDILMKAQPTPLLRACQTHGVRASPGLEMMLQQAPEYLEYFDMDDIAAV